MFNCIGMLIPYCMVIALTFVLYVLHSRGNEILLIKVAAMQLSRVTDNAASD